MSDGQAASPALHSAAPAHAPSASMDVGMHMDEAPSETQPLMAASPIGALSTPASHQSLAQQMQVFLTRTDMQQSRKNRFYLQQVFELLSELDQHTAPIGLAAIRGCVWPGASSRCMPASTEALGAWAGAALCKTGLAAWPSDMG